MPSTNTATRYAYDAFLSYSHGADAKVAPAVHRALSRLAKPWNRSRALRIFRDQASLEASPDLWATIEAKLSASRHLVLLASPQAARSRWVAREIAYWKQHREPATLLIVLTSGAIHWDHTARNFDRTRTTALPPEVFGWFAAEPLWVDLTWAYSEVELSLDHARFRQDIGTLAASLHGVSKDELDSEEARQHARTVGVRRGLTWGLVFFLVASLVFGVMAQTRGDEAERQRKEADGQRRVATVRALLAESENRLADDPRTAVRLGLTAYSVRPTTETRAALVDVLQRTPYAGASRGPDDVGQFVRRLSDDMRRPGHRGRRHAQALGPLTARAAPPAAPPHTAARGCRRHRLQPRRTHPLRGGHQGPRPLGHRHTRQAADATGPARRDGPGRRRVRRRRPDADHRARRQGEQRPDGPVGRGRPGPATPSRLGDRCLRCQGRRDEPRRQDRRERHQQGHFRRGGHREDHH